MSLDTLSKEEIEHELMQYQKKLIKIIKAEERLSSQNPVNTSRLKRQTTARIETSNYLKSLFNRLVDLGGAIDVKLKRKVLKEE